jgi:hypothetical protein
MQSQLGARDLAPVQASSARHKLSAPKREFLSGLSPAQRGGSCIGFFRPLHPMPTRPCRSDRQLFISLIQ